MFLMKQYQPVTINSISSAGAIGKSVHMQNFLRWTIFIYEKIQSQKPRETLAWNLKKLKKHKCRYLHSFPFILYDTGVASPL